MWFPDVSWGPDVNFRKDGQLIYTKKTLGLQLKGWNASANAACPWVQHPKRCWISMGNFSSSFWFFAAFDFLYIFFFGYAMRLESLLRTYHQGHFLDISEVHRSSPAATVAAAPGFQTSEGLHSCLMVSKLNPFINHH